MGIIDQKSKVFGKISAVRTLSEGLPKLTTNPSFPSINNDGDSIAFLTDMLKSLVGIEKLRDIIVDTLTYKLDEIETTIKTEMKRSLKELVNCGVDPSLPNYLKSTGSGIVTEVNKVDFFDMMKTDTVSSVGKLMYTDTNVSPLTSSNDYNTFLYGTVQNDGTTETWSSVLDVKFDSINTPDNNTLTFNANPSFDSKTLTEFNNTYVDSIDLFNSEKLLNKLLDDMFGSLSVQLNKTTSQLKKEEEINSIIDCIVNADENDVIDDSYFTFTNEQTLELEEKANLRKKGVMLTDCCGNIPTSLPPQLINTVTSGITSATTVTDKKESISNGISELGEAVSLSSPDSKDRYSLELNFIDGLIKNLVKSIVSIVLSPNIISIFLINYKIVYGLTETYESATDFMKQNKTLVKNVSDTVRDAIIKIILETVLKEITSLVAQTAITIATEKAKNQLAQILSLVGIPQNILRLIKGI